MLTMKSKMVLEALQVNKGLDLTAKDVADITKLPIRTVVAVFNGLVRKGLGFRQEVTKGEDTVKYLRLTDAGLTYQESDLGE